MSVSVNKVILAGNLTRDPQVKFLPSEQAVANFGIAINRKYKKGSELMEEVTFVDIECWGKTAELVGQYLTKGRACLVEGHLKLDQWDDKDGGGKRSKLKVVADGVQFLDSGKGERDEAPAAAAPSKPSRPSIPSVSRGDDSGSPPF